jgi:hypothetical protein
MGFQFMSMAIQLTYRKRIYVDN